MFTDVSHICDTGVTSSEKIRAALWAAKGAARGVRDNIAKFQCQPKDDPFLLLLVSR